MYPVMTLLSGNICMHVRYTYYEYDDTILIITVSTFTKTVANTDTDRDTLTCR